MPRYKKKHINKFSRAPKPKKDNRVKSAPLEDIEMTPSAPKRKKSSTLKKPDNMKVIKGKKLENQRKFRIWTVTIALIAAVVFILNTVLPVGILENIQNVTALIGSGGYPIELGSREVINTDTRSGYYYVLTDTELNAFSSGGKEIYSIQHGAENPILKTSKTRALIFEQGGTTLNIYNLAEQKNNLKTENGIITAGISDSGVYAVVTHSPSYSSVVSVYDRRDRLIYEWSSAKETVNNVAVSPNGKKIAVSLFNADGGSFNSKVYVLDFKDATPENTVSYEGSLVYNLDSFHSRGFFALTETGADFISWSKYQKTEYKNDYSLSLFRSAKGGSIAAFNRLSDKTDNRIAIFDSKGEKKSEFNFKGIISDIEYSGGHIYCISDTYVYLLSSTGEVLRQAECGFGAVRLSRTATDIVAVMTDNQIEQIKLREK